MSIQWVYVLLEVFFPVWSSFVPMLYILLYFHYKCYRHTARCCRWSFTLTSVFYWNTTFSVFCLYFVFLIMWFNMLIDLIASSIHREPTLSSVRFMFKALLWSWKAPVPFLPDVRVCSVCCLCMLWKLQALKKSPLGPGWDLSGVTVLPQPLSPIKSLLWCQETVKTGTDDGHTWVLLMSWYHRREENGQRIRAGVALMVALHHGDI